MAFPDPNEPSATSINDLELVNTLIESKEAGEPVDADILALLTDMERLGLTDTDAYAALDAYRPGPAVGATGGDDEVEAES
ncbi:hypothetical protein SAMN02799622_00570 [Methylobacterium sp. UNC378MF]|jgi:hypothetical protein|uniref:hypothetical protein n=1 Tax=unclassified Methylobacterium TaxID=2615210 RepID=UPI00089046A3|nr:MULTISPECIES: hypothetical protein [unclassified Methylobacterium]KAA0122867.1 hypothetical protein CIW48_15610 [Methylobacterium sp. P1-11]SDA11295.1 hypothetical protein SAMN02799622_00570 [Methylobacterium sp. UNC378MF]